MADARTKRGGEVAHPAIAFALPFLTIWIALIRVVGGALGQMGIDIFSPLTGWLVALAGVVEITRSAARAGAGAGRLGALVREIGLIVIVSFLLLLVLTGEARALFSDEAGGGALNLARVDLWVSLGAVALQWVLTLIIHERLKERERFLRFFGDDDVARVAETYASHSHEAGLALEGLRAVRSLITGFQITALASLLLAGWALAAPLTWGDRALVVGFFVVTIALRALLARYAETQQSLSAGRVTSREDVASRDSAALLLLALCTGAALLLAGRGPLVPVTIFAAAWQWIVSRRPGREEIGPIDLPELGPARSVDEFGELARQSDQLAGGAGRESGLSGVIGWIALGIAVAALLAFLVAPLLRRDRERLGLRGYLSALGERLRVLARGVRDAFAALFGALRASGAAIAGRVRETLGGSARAGGRDGGRADSESRAARRAQSRALRTFMRLVRWGEKQGARFAPSVGPLEFAERVAERVPGRRTDLREAACMYEEIVFSRNHGSETLEKAYQDRVSSIVSGK